MSFPRYPKYKASGVEWLGEVPEHWAIQQIKRTTYLKARVGWKGLTSEEFRDNAFAYLVTGSDFRGKFVEWEKCYQVEQDRYEDDPFIQLENGDLLISKDGTIGKLAIVSGLDRPACLNSGIFVARPRNTYSTAFMYWILSSKVFSVFCDLESFGCTINHLYQNVFERFTFPAPPESEQTAIATFLDRETAKIDGLVAEQRQLMELLKEKRKAVITHAVIKGLNPDAKMKPSGVEWLGDVPEHWEVTRLGFLCSKIGSGKTPSGGGEAYLNEGILFIRSQNVYDEGLYLKDVVYVSGATDAEQSWSRVLAGDILLNITGASLGRTCLVPDKFEPANVNQHVCIIRLATHASRHFVSMVLKSTGMKAQFDAAQNGAAREGLNFAQISKLVLAIPPATEQAEILDFLDTELAKFDTLTAEAQRTIDLLQERRTALISAAVTGQIDVQKEVT